MTPNTPEALGKSQKLTPDLAVSLQGNIDDLYKVVHRSAKTKFEACYGCITDSVSLRKYGLYSVSDCTQDASDHNWKLVPLTDVLESTGKELPVLTYADTLRLAWVVSSSVSKLHITTWMPKTLGHSDVFFIQRPGQNLFEDVFVLKELPDDPLLQEEAAVQTCEVKMEGSERYEEAVRRFLKGELHFQGRNVEGDGFRQDVFGTIVNLLEEDMNDCNCNFV
ncbi:hypothetical protein CSOJ01_09291 [Colletotrichum sojae]|uniref:Uncharacterized protein n=1 Tax=Colletotrichum sojae TaxID=2175907 RepID=A0A8H6J3J4_9PEZI|nr:hypothetical protein CSOJ01_09291 [Colletotrichum sojae]